MPGVPRPPRTERPLRERALASLPRAFRSDTVLGYRGNGLEGRMVGYSQSKDELQARLRRVEGQVRGLQRLVDEDTYCIDVLTQISAVNAALRKVAVALLDDHLRHCVRDAASDDASGEAIITEATAAIDRLLKS